MNRGTSFSISRTVRALFFATLLSTTFLYSAAPLADAHAEDDESRADAVPQAGARPQIIKVTSKGISPTELNMSQSDSVVFFYNATDDDLVSLEIDFGKNSVHCSAAMKIVTEPGLTRTRKPFGPKEFASTCFHEKGRYPFKAFTSKKGASPYNGWVVVQ